MNKINPTHPLKLGRIVANSALFATLSEKLDGDAAIPSFLRTALERHHIGDWGEVCDADWQQNDRSAINGDRMLSSYSLPVNENESEHFWIITE